MISKEHILTTEELTQFSHKCLMDDRQDYIIEILNNIADRDENSIEDRVLAFYNLGDIYWNFIGDFTRAIEYMNMSIELSHKSQEDFKHVLRGNIWNSKLRLLSELGNYSEIETEIEKIIDKYSSGEFDSNSLLHYAYTYKADLEYGQGNYKIALENLINAQAYYPIKFYANNLHVIEVSDYKNEFDNLKLLLSRNICSTKDWQM